MSRRRAQVSTTRPDAPPRALPRAKTGSSKARPAHALGFEEPVRRSTHRLTKVLISLGLFVTVVAVGGQWVLHQSIFRVQHVTVLGVRHESMSAVLNATGLDGHPSMVGVSSGSLEKSLSSFAWINGVSVVKHWPNSIVVTVHETTPVAVAFDAHHQLQYVNKTGRDLGAAPLRANFPTLIFLAPKNSSWPFARAGLGAAIVANQLPKAFANQVSTISVNASGVVTLKMTTPLTFVLGEPTELHRKFVAIASVIAHTVLKPGDVVDVSVPDELTVTGPAPS